MVGEPLLAEGIETVAQRVQLVAPLLFCKWKGV